MAASDATAAIVVRVIDTASDVIQGRRAPQDGARDLERIRTDVVRLEAALRPFIGLAAEWDLYTDRRPEIERDMLVAAETLRRSLAE